MIRTIIVLTILLLATSLLSGCFPGGGHATADEPAGFFLGIWHGWIAPISLIFGIFEDTVRVYEVNNTGWFYDFGFYMAIISGFGSLSLFRREKEHE